MTSTRYSDDAAKTDPDSEDELGYGPFALHLAKFIHRQPAPKGYVIGLQGAWGSGKSTALNFVKARLAELSTKDPKRIRVIDFRPWIISGHQDLVSGYFKVLQEALQPGNTVRTRRTKAGVRLVRSSLDPLAGAAGALGAALDPVTQAAIRGGAGAVGKGVGAALERWLVEPSLQSAYERLGAQLAESERRFLVLIDDLDRLEPGEIKTIVQMVKSVGRLPNVIYLLAYDREIVWNALGREAAGPRPSFMEKIVQQEVELPPPTRDRLMRMLAVEAGFVGETAPGDMRWHYLLHSGFFRWIRSPRDVARLANAAKFAWAALEGEVDPHELLAMEAMRLFDNSLYSWIRDNRDFLLGGSGTYVSDNAVKDAADALRETLPAGTRDDQLQVVAALFPSRAKAFLGDRFSGGRPYFVAHNRGGVQSPAGYDSYFALYPSPNAIPKAVVRASMARLDDEAFQIAQFEAVLPMERENGAPLIADYLADLAFRFIGHGAPRPTQALLNAIFAKSDAFLRIDRAGTDFAANPHTQLRMLLHQVFERLGQEDTGAGLLAAAEAHPSPVLLADLWLEEAVAHGRLSVEGERQRQPRIDATALDRLGEVLLRQIQDHKSGPLLNPPPLIYGVWKTWSHLADVEAPRRWLAEGAARDPEFLVAVASSYLATSGSVGARQFSYSTRSEQLMDPEALLVAAEKHRDAKFLAAEDRSRISALIEGLLAERAAKAAPREDADDRLDEA